MKVIKAQVEYKVPHWAFCNSDTQDFDRVGKYVCKFCKKDRGGVRCLLFDCSLSTDGEFISKARRCQEVTAGHNSTIISDSVDTTPAIEPKKVIKHAVDLYIKNMNSLMRQGYPRELAEQLAKELTLNG